jgi:two-component system chemotaxis sensor kinase CheA
LPCLDLFARTNDSLIAATAGLSQLSEDKDVHTRLGDLVSAAQVIERNSREHALLSYVFGTRSFPAPIRRYLVTSLTEQEVYAASLQTWTSVEALAQLEQVLKGPRAESIAAMRQVALDTTAGTLDLSARAWFDTQSDQMRALNGLQHQFVGAVREVIGAKRADAWHRVRLAMGLALGVAALSLVLARVITRGLTHSVGALAKAAESVNQSHDFATRATKKSDDELGLLTDAFNDMLEGIQERDSALAIHRANLETLVAARTRLLSEHRQDLALVLNHVDQGLAVIDRAGRFRGESSDGFKQAFPAFAQGAPFYDIVASEDERVRDGLRLGYEQLIAEVQPIHLALEQLSRRLVHSGRHHTLSFTPIHHGTEFVGTLLITRDITSELVSAEIGSHLGPAPPDA